MAVYALRPYGKSQFPFAFLSFAQAEAARPLRDEASKIAELLSAGSEDILVCLRHLRQEVLHGR